MLTSDLISSLPLLLAIIYLGLFLLTFVQIQQRNRWLLVFLALSSVWQLALYLAQNQMVIDVPSKILLICTMALGGATAVYNKRRPSRAWLFGSISLLLGTIVSDLFLTQDQLGTRIDIAAAVRAGSWLALTLTILAFNWRQIQQTRSPRQANRSLFWLIALLIVFSGEFGAILNSILVSFAGQWLRLLGSLMLLYAVTHHNLFDVRTRLWKITAVLLTTSITALPTVVAIILSPLFLTRLSTIIVLLIVLFNLLLFVPIFRLVSMLVNRFLFGKRINSRQIIRDYSRQVANTLEINELASVAIQSLNKYLHIDSGTLMLGQTNYASITLEPIPALGIIPHQAYQFNNDNRFVHALKQQVPILRDEIEDDMRAMLSTTDLNWFKLINMEVYVPISSGDEITGVLAIGPKSSGAIFQQGELDLLQLLAEQTSVALQNARLFRQLETQNESIRKLNESLQRQNKHLEALDQVKIDFISIASHELRTPLTQVKGYSDLLAGLSKEGSLTGQQTYEIMTNIDRATDQLERVIAAMLDASQLDAEDVQLQISEVEMTTLVKTAVTPFQMGLRERRITFHTAKLDQLPPVELDFKRMGQALTNIIGNAIKFTPDRGSIDITGQVVKDVNAATYVELVIADSGIGIDPQYHELIFEKFFRIGATQLHSSGNTKFKGAGPGLGLHIAKGVIHAHGGRIWVESPGEDEEKFPGSEFHIILPVHQNKLKDREHSA